MQTFKERHQPKSLGDFVLESSDEQIVQNHIDGKTQENIILYGPFGTGKSTLSEFISIKRQGFIQRIDATKVKSFLDDARISYYMLFYQCHHPYFIIDEADTLTNQMQLQLRAYMDVQKSNFSFILTTNNFHAIDHGIRSRSECIELLPISAPIWLDRTRTILTAEGVSRSDKDISQLIAVSGGDIRILLRALERLCLNNATAHQHTNNSTP